MSISISLLFTDIDSSRLMDMNYVNMESGSSGKFSSQLNDIQRVEKGDS